MESCTRVGEGKGKYLSIFAPSDSGERQKNFEAYWAYTQEHDGEILEAEKDLSKKKTILASFYSRKVRSRNPLPDADLFYRNYVEWVDPAALLDRKTLLFTCIYKFARHEWAGISEAWEVIPSFGDAKTLTEKISRYHLCEEFCHVRLFHEMFRTFQLEDVQWAPFPKLKRNAYRMFAKFPEKLMSAPAFVSELMGMSLYLAIDRILDSVLADEPEAKARIRELLHEIMVDELAHIGQRRNYLGKVGMIASRLMVRPMITAFFRDIPEAKYLLDIDGMVREGLAFDYSQVPPAMIEKSWVPSYCQD